MDDNLATCLSRGVRMIEEFYSPPSQPAVAANNLLLIQPLHVVIGKERHGGALLALDDWKSDFVPAIDDYLSVGPNHCSNKIRFRLVHRGRIALFLNGIDLIDRASRNSGGQIRRWIENGWCPVWADLDVCDELDFRSGNLAFTSRSDTPGTFLDEIRNLEGK